MIRRCSVEGVPHPIDLHVGERVRERRNEIGAGQQWLAEQIGLTFQQVQKYEFGRNRISASKLFQIASALHTSVDYFFEGMAEHEIKSDAAERAMIAEFTGRPEWIELAAAFPKIRSGKTRRRVVELIKAVLDDEGACG